MTIERTDDEVIIRMPKFVDFEAMQRTIDLISLKEATARSVATREDIYNGLKNKGFDRVLLTSELRKKVD